MIQVKPQPHGVYWARVDEAEAAVRCDPWEAARAATVRCMERLTRRSRPKDPANGFRERPVYRHLPAPRLGYLHQTDEQVGRLGDCE